MKWRTWVPFLFALALGLVALVLSKDIIARRTGLGGPSRKYVQVVVAKRDLAPGYKIDAADLTFDDRPAENVGSNVMTKMDGLAGRVVATPIIKGQTMLEGLLAPPGAGSGLQALVPAGMRAVAVEVNEFSGVAGLLVPGCRVDVIATLQDNKTDRVVTRTIVQNAHVSAVGQEMAAPKQSGGVITSESIRTLPKSVTLIVKPKQAELLELAASKGRLRLVLRSTADTVATGSEGLTIAELMGMSLAHPQQATAKLAQFLLTAQGRLQETDPDTEATDDAQMAAGMLGNREVTPVHAARRSVQVIRGGAESVVSFDEETGVSSTTQPSSGKSLSLGNGVR